LYGGPSVAANLAGPCTAAPPSPPISRNKENNGERGEQQIRRARLLSPSHADTRMLMIIVNIVAGECDSPLHNALR
jgi:hypothetical protein